MSTKTKANDTQASLLKFTVAFWTYVETHCTHKGLATKDRPYFGLRTSDPVELQLKDGLKRTSVEDLWRAFCRKSGVNADLMTSSIAARNAGQLMSYTAKGKSGGKHEGRVFGTKFWTKTNPKFIEVRGERKASMIDELPSLV